MGRAFVCEIWSELADDWSVIVFWVGLVSLSAFTGIGWPSLPAVAGGMIAVRTIEAVQSAAGVPEYVSGIVIGVGVAGYGAWLLNTSFSLVYVSFCCIGVWFVFDACYEWRRGITPPDSPAEELIATTLHESATPLAAETIATRTGLSVEAVERTLEERGGGPIRQVDNRYTVRDPPTGSIDRLWNEIPRPLRLFSGESWR